MLFVLKIDEEWKAVNINDFSQTLYEVLPTYLWNYGIIYEAVEKKQFLVVQQPIVAAMTWNLQNTPICIIVQGKTVEQRQEYNDSAGGSCQKTV